MRSRLSFALVLLCAAVLAVVIAGCSDSGDGTEPFGQSAWELNANDKAAFSYFVGKGLTNFQSAGIIGNLDQESQTSPTAVQSGGPGRGIAQWSVGGRWDTSTNDNAVGYAQKQVESVWSLQLQLEFIWYELQTFSGYGLAALKKTTNVTDATIAFQTDFEKCGTCAQSTRISYAKAALNAYGAIPYAASFVAQSFPLATTSMKMVAGDVAASYIELKNTGTKTWDSNTRIGTTQPRDRKSAFADGTWLAPNRLAAVKGTVPPGGTYKFQFDLAAPAKAGTYDEFFGVVEEGVAWFSDTGQGGPADDNLEVKIVVAANPNLDAGAPANDAGSAPDDAGTSGGDGSATKPKGDAGWADVQPGGCSIGPSRASRAAGGGAGGAGGAWAVGLLLVGAAMRRRTHRRL